VKLFQRANEKRRPRRRVTGVQFLICALLITSINNCVSKCTNTGFTEYRLPINEDQHTIYIVDVGIVRIDHISDNGCIYASRIETIYRTPALQPIYQARSGVTPEPNTALSLKSNNTFPLHLKLELTKCHVPLGATVRTAISAKKLRHLLERIVENLPAMLSINDSFLFRNSPEAAKFGLISSIVSSCRFAANCVNQAQQSMYQHIRSGLPHDDAADVVAALVLGSKRVSVPERVKFVFRRTGVGHLLAVSGMHLGASALFALTTFSLLLRRSYWLKLRINTRKIAAIIALIVTGAHYGLVGFSPSSARACIMTSIGLLAIVSSRRFNAPRAFLLAALCILPYSRATIRSSELIGNLVSASFSFGIVCALLMTKQKDTQIILTPSVTHSTLRKVITHTTNLMHMSIIAWLASVPISLIYFGTFSLVAPLFNLLAIPLFTLFILPASILGSVINSSTILILAHSALSIFIRITTWITAIPNLHMDIGDNRSYWQICLLVLSYFTLLAVLRLPRRVRTDQIKYMIYLTGIGLIYIAFTCTQPNPIFCKHQDMCLTMIDVGHGDSLYLQFPNGKTMLIDAGSYYKNHSYIYSRILPTIYRSGHRQLTAGIVTHADNDHIGGWLHYFGAKVLPKSSHYKAQSTRSFLENRSKTNGSHTQQSLPTIMHEPLAMEVKKLWLSTTTLEHNEGQSLQRSLEGRKTILEVFSTIKEARALQRDRLNHTFCPNNPNSCRISVLWPATDNKSANRHVNQVRNRILGEKALGGTPHPSRRYSQNNSSVVLKVTYGSTSILFTGDIEAKIERELLARSIRETDEKLNATIIKIAHHGSKTSSIPEFIDTVDPMIALISSKPGRFKHPSSKTLWELAYRKIRILRTDLDGQISLHVSPKGSIQISRTVLRNNTPSNRRSRVPIQQ